MVFCSAIGKCVETIAKLKDVMRLVTDQTRPSTALVKASLEQWEGKLRETIEQQEDFQVWL
jgi:hypothetical protein